MDVGIRLVRSRFVQFATGKKYKQEGHVFFMRLTFFPELHLPRGISSERHVVRTMYRLQRVRDAAGEKIIRHIRHVDDVHVTVDCFHLHVRLDHIGNIQKVQR